MMGISADSKMEEVILTVFAIIVLIVFAGCLYTFVRAIFFFIFSQSKEENKKKGWNSIRFMIIGLILTFLLLLIVPTVLRFMGIPNYNNYSMVKVFRKSSSLMGDFFRLGNIIRESQELNQYRGDFYYDMNKTNSTDTSSADFEL